MYICGDCGNVFDDDELVTEKEGRGEFWGVPVYQEFCACPKCRSGYISEAVKCPICGKYFEDDAMEDGICSDCLEKQINIYRFDIDGCYEIAEEAEEEESISINGFLASMFDEKQINEILLRELKESRKIKPVDCSGFVESDISWFVNQILERSENK